MARRRRKKTWRFSPEQARQALAILIDEGKVAAGEVALAFERREDLMRSIRARLAELGVEARVLTRRLVKRAAPVLRSVARKAAPIVRRVARKRKRRAARRTPTRPAALPRKTRPKRSRTAVIQRRRPAPAPKRTKRKIRQARKASPAAPASAAATEVAAEKPDA